MLDKETREMLGRALYEASYDTLDFTDSRTPRWENLLSKESWIRKAEAVVETYERLREDKQIGTQIR